MTNAAPPPLPTAPVRTSTARANGVSPRRLRGRRVVRPFHGVVTAGLPPFEVEDLCRAYLPVLPPGGFFSGPTAATLHGLPLPRPPKPLHVSVPAPGRAPRSRGVHGHSVRIAYGDVVMLRGLPVSCAERAWAELATSVTVEDLVVAGDVVLRDAVGGADRESLQRMSARYPGSRGRPARLAALSLIDPRSESPQESRLRCRLVCAGISDGVPNEELRTTRGRRYRGDLVFAEARLILEYQGDHHREPPAYRRDLSRRLDLQAEGWTVVELGPDDLDDPGLPLRVRALIAHGQRSLRSSAQAVSS